MKQCDRFPSLLLLVLLGCACTGSPEESVSGVTEGEFGRSACQSCVSQSCSAELARCGQEPVCAAHWRCIKNCPVGPTGDANAACEAACTQAVPLVSNPAQVASTDLLRCRTQDAGTACAACGYPASQRGSRHPLLNQQCAVSSDPNPCYRCEDERCCQSYAQYSKNPYAVSLRECYAMCVDPMHETECHADCRQTNPEGVQDFSTRLLCVTSRCGVECNKGKPLDACTDCSLSHCSDAIIACGTDPDCNLLMLCSETCLGTNHGYPTGCPQSCLSRAALPAQKLYLEYLLCTSHSCGAECGEPTL